MTKKPFFISVILCIIIFALLMPSFAQRVKYEGENSGAILSLDYSYLLENAKQKELYKFLQSAKEKGINTVSISSLDDENAILKDFKLALFTDALCVNEAEIKKIKALSEKGRIKYISISGEITNSNFLNELIDLIKKNELTLVFKETQNQLANDGGRELFLSGEIPSLARCYDTSYSKNEKINPNLRSHQMQNSLKDRNTRFINLVPFEEKEADFNKNYYAMLESVELFNSQISKLGYSLNNNNFNYKGYMPNRSFNLTLSFLLSLCLCYIIILMLVGISCKFINLLLLVLAVIGSAIPYINCEFSQNLYPLFLCIVSSCFTITMILYCARRFCECGFVKCLCLSFLTALLAFALRGYSLCAVLSGVDYYMYFSSFRGVKISLVIPPVFSVFAYIRLYGFKKINFKISINIKNLCFVFLVAIFGIIAAYLYILRSGNSIISDFEINFRNTLDSLMGIRPRTKEFLIGWPSLALFVWYVKNTKQNLIPLILAMGVGILASSVLNSFCHVFTKVSFIYLRTFNGFLLSVPLCVLALLLNRIVYKILKKAV